MREINTKLLNKLVLGTAQIGSKYGITNSQVISNNETKEIFNFSQKIKKTVNEKFDILLEEEVNII